MRRRRSSSEGKNEPTLTFGMRSSRSPAAVVSVLGRWPLRWVVRVSARSCGPAPDVRGRLRLDQLLQQPLGKRAHEVTVLRRTQRVEQ